MDGLACLQREAPNECGHVVVVVLLLTLRKHGTTEPVSVENRGLAYQMLNAGVPPYRYLSPRGTHPAKKCVRVERPA